MKYLYEQNSRTASGEFRREKVSRELRREKRTVKLKNVNEAPKYRSNLS